MAQWNPDKRRQRIVGALTGQFTGQQVALVGQCIGVQNDSKQLKLKCTDDHILLVHLVNPVMHPIATNAYIEVQGILESRNKLKGYKLFVYDSEASSNFDAKSYNETIAQIMTHGDTLSNGFGST